MSYSFHTFREQLFSPIQKVFRSHPESNWRVLVNYLNIKNCKVYVVTPYEM